MSFIPLNLSITPGVDTVSTPLLAETRIVDSCNLRFFQGKVQQIGAFQRLTSQKPRGICRGLFPWADTSGSQYIAEGTNEELAVINNGNLYDITPIVATSDLAAPFSTVNGSQTVTVADPANIAVTGNWVNINNYAAVANLLLQGAYEITGVGINNFTISAPIAANATVSGGGTVAQFTTTNGSAIVAVQLPNHGFQPGGIFTAHVSTTVGGLTLYGPYVVQTVIDAGNLTIVAAGNATSAASAFENSGNVDLQYLLASGSVSGGGIAGYGQMPYGIGPYGLGYQVGYLPLRQWFFGAWGSFLMANPTNGGIYVWMPAAGFFSNPATRITQAPPANAAIFIAMAQQQIITMGSSSGLAPSYSVQDPLLVRWCNVADYTDWVPTVTNQAGSFRLPRGSRIVGGLQTPQQGLIWTDLGLWAQQYIGAPFIYSFNEIGLGCGLISARAMCVAGNVVPWMSQKGFFLYQGGGVAPIPCPIWDTIFDNLDLTQIDKITCAPNAAFTEVSWHLPTTSGENDFIAKLNLIDGSWDYSAGAEAQPYVRTAAVDQSVIGPAMGVDINSLLQQSETGDSADGLPIVSRARTGWFKMQGGEIKAFIERILPDLIQRGTTNLTFSIYTAQYPNDTPILRKSVRVTATTKYIIIRSRSRLAALQIDCSSTEGGFWRLGEPLFKIAAAGSR